jgi:hypothetical protein
MGQDHPSAAVALQAQHVQSLPGNGVVMIKMSLLGINFVLLQEVKVLVPLVADDLVGV